VLVMPRDMGGGAPAARVTQMEVSAWICSRCGRKSGAAYAGCTDCGDSQICNECFEDGDRYCDECRAGEIVRVADAHRRSSGDERAVEAARCGVGWTGRARLVDADRASTRWCLMPRSEESS
jgi:hypothetical protein